MKIYEMPVIQIEKFEIEDFITTSSLEDDSEIGGGNH